MALRVLSSDCSCPYSVVRGYLKRGTIRASKLRMNKCIYLHVGQASKYLLKELNMFLERKNKLEFHDQRNFNNIRTSRQ